MCCLAVQEQKKKRRRKAAEEAGGKKAAGADADDSWVGNHPWRPFDRDRDLAFGPKAVSKEELLKKAGTLDSRFGGGASGNRSFL